MKRLLCVCCFLHWGGVGGRMEQAIWGNRFGASGSLTAVCTTTAKSESAVSAGNASGRYRPTACAHCCVSTPPPQIELPQLFYPSVQRTVPREGGGGGARVSTHTQARKARSTRPTSSAAVYCSSGSRLLVLGSWVGVRHPFHLSLFPTAPRVVLPQDPGTNAMRTCRISKALSHACSARARAACWRSCLALAPHLRTRALCCA